MLPHQQRVVDERNELEEKFCKLCVFIEESPIYDSLPDADRELLRVQADTMETYLNILSRRINRFNGYSLNETPTCNGGS